MSSPQTNSESAEKSNPPDLPEAREGAENPTPDHPRDVDMGPDIPPLLHTPPLTLFLRENVTQIVRRFGYQGEIRVTDEFISRVSFYIRYFTKDQTGSRFFRRALVRSQTEVPMITRVFREKQLPEDLAYLALIESGFNPNARSTAGAIGMWQFMEGTARDYGLVVSGTTDERRNPEKSTVAAAEHLDNLLAVFGTEDPFLGISAYNAGEGKVIGALKHLSFRERSFWALVGNGLLQSETEEYIPKLLAAIILVNNRERFGLTDEMLQQERVSDEEEIIAVKRSTPATSAGVLPKSSLQKRAKPETAAVSRRSAESSILTYKVKRGDTLGRIAEAFGVDISDLMAWNGRKKETISPGESLQIHTEGPWKSVRHVVQKNETLGKVAESYGVPPGMIHLMNGAVNERLRAGSVLHFYAPASPVGSSARSEKHKAKVSPPVQRGYKVEYTVQPGSTLSQIALAFDLEIPAIRRWNNMKRSHIQAGQKLILYLPSKPLRVTIHTVRKGETAGSIAKHYRVRLDDDLLALNGLLHGSKLVPGMKLKIYRFTNSGS